MKTIRRLSAIIIGFVLFISGALKLMDPVGAGLVMDEYFSFLHLGFMSFASSLFGAGFALCETILGIALITGVWRKAVAFVSLCFLGLFTLLTAILWIFNPSMDCGCFGEAIKLTHAQSFFKNCILMALWVLAFIPVREQEPTRKIKYVSFGIASISSCLFLLYASFSIPLMDFTSLKTGPELYCEENIDFEEIDDFSKLHELYPDIGFFSEEEAGRLHEKCWILDPIDGTTNLVYGYNMSSVSLALYMEDKVVFGVVYNPFSEAIRV